MNKLIKPSALLPSALLLVTLLGGPWSTSDSYAQAPNVVVIVADDAGFADWGFMDGVNGSNPTASNIPTPNLDALASRGVKFSRAYVAQSCQPTRAALVTGGYQNRIGNEVVGNNYYLPTQGFASKGIQEGVPGATTTIWERMKAQGYSTGAVGKWHLGQTSEYTDENGNTVAGNRPQDQGVDEFYGIWHGSRSYFGGCCGGSETQALREAIVHPNGSVTDNIVESAHNGEYVTNTFGDYAVDFIDNHHADANPFFLYQSFTAPHTPLQNSPDFNDPSIAGLSGDRKTYASMMLTMDKEIGRILDRLEDPDGDGNTSDSIKDNTLVVFVNDNGGPQSLASNESDNGVLRNGKGTPWEGGIRVPMIVAGAGVNAGVHGTTYSKPVHGVDILPTAFAAAGGTFAPSDNKIDGVDLLPFINGTNTADPHDVLVHKHRTQFSVIKGDWKLVWSGTTPPAFATSHHLYNLATDVDESSNVNSANPAIVAQLQRDLTDHEVTFDKPRYEILNQTSETTINIFDHFTFKPAVGGGGTGGSFDIVQGSTGNGDFEDSEPASGAISYDSTVNWHNAGGAETINFTNDTQTGGSTQSGSRAGMPFQNRTQVNDSGHTITQAGEVFSLSYDFGAGGNAANWGGDEIMRTFLFTSGVTVDGNLIESNITELNDNSYNIDLANDGQWTSHSVANLYTTTAADIGKTVYFGMEFLDPSVTNTLFPRIDIVDFSVTVPGGSGTVPTTNWSAAGGWFEGGTTNVDTMLHFDSFAGAILEFPTTDTGSYISNNDMVRSTGLEFMMNRMVLSGTFNGAEDQSATIQGKAVLFTNDLDGVAPQLVVQANNGGANSYSYDVDLDLVLYNDLTITGDGDVSVTINGQIRDYHTPRSLIKSGTSKVTLAGNNTYEGDTTVEAGTLSITSPFLEDTADLYLLTGAILDLDFSGTDTIDALFIDGISQALGTWGAVGSGANNESALFTGSGLVLVSTLEALTGDFNGSGFVDGVDFLTWQRDLRDAGSLAAWQANYGSSAATASSTAVPEPAAGVLMLMALQFLAGVRIRTN